MEARISLITLGVADLERARRFYAEGLKLPLQAESTPEVAFFGLQGLWLGLYPRAALAADAHLDPAGSGFGGITLAHNVRTRDEVFSVLAEAMAAGGSVLKPAGQTDWGGFSGYFADPDGYPWEVAWNPHFWIE